MRKRYVERLSYYKLLEELNQLPDETFLTPLFIEKIDDEKLKFVDYFVVIQRSNLDHFSHPFESFVFRFYYKSKNERISISSRFGCEIEMRDFELTNFCFNSKILTVSDFFRAAFSNIVDYVDSLSKVQHSDNEGFVLIQTL